MKTVHHPANSRGRANHGWLQSYHSFSFADYYNPERMGFGLLRVLNDDRVSPAMGFGTHPHRDMEIVSIPLSGALAHQDSEGNSSIIQSGDVQLMSAGTGIMHSEFNASKDEEVRFLQIWVQTRTKGIKPRYAQNNYTDHLKANEWLKLVTPEGQEPAIGIEQDATFSLVQIDAGKQISYQWQNPKHGVYFFLIDGHVTIADQELAERDALGVWESSTIEIQSQQPSRLLAIEVPMEA